MDDSLSLRKVFSQAWKSYLQKGWLLILTFILLLGSLYGTVFLVGYILPDNDGVNIRNNINTPMKLQVPMVNIEDILKCQYLNG